MTPTNFFRLSILGSTTLIATAARAGVGIDGGGRRFSATLTGAAEVPGPGDSDGAGKAIIELNPGQNKLCYKLRVSNIAPATMAHVHIGPVGVAGGAVVTLTAPADGTSADCKTVSDELAKALLKTPGNYYVNVHTADFPNGAIRGQLTK
jgi:hypothetical protein